MRAGVLVFISILLFIEVYAYTGLRSMLSQNKQLLGLCLYVAILIFSITAIFLFFQQNSRTVYILPNQLINILFGIAFAIFIAKLIFVLFLLITDIVRPIQYVFEKVVYNRELISFPSRRKFLVHLGVGIAAVPFISLLYGVLKGKYDFTVHRTTIKFPDLPEAFDGFKIVQISDIHSGSFDNKEAVQKGIDLIQAQQGDVILFTGDLVNNFAEEIVPYISMFKNLEAPMGKFSVLGNHDYGDYVAWPTVQAKIKNLQTVISHNESMGFKMLNNDSVQLKKGEASITIAGVENWGLPPFPQKGDLNKALEKVSKDDFCVLMSHDPSHWDAQIKKYPKKVNLTLSGHTHGMQFGIEIPGFKWSPVKYKYPNWAGLYEDTKQYLYVNRGFGFLGFPGRAGIWPEVSVIELRKGDS